MRTDNVLVIDVEIEENISPFLPVYRGSYDIYPGREEHDIPTAQTVSWQDFHVHPIVYREELNAAGGITAIIGGEDNGDQQG